MARRKISRANRLRILSAYNDLLEDSGGRKYKGEVTELAKEYGVCTATIHTIVRAEKKRALARAQDSAGDLVPIRGNWTSTINRDREMLLYLERCRDGVYIRPEDKKFFAWDVVDMLVEELLRLRGLNEKG